MFTTFPSDPETSLAATYTTIGPASRHMDVCEQIVAPRRR